MGGSRPGRIGPGARRRDGPRKGRGRPRPLGDPCAEPPRGTLPAGLQGRAGAEPSRWRAIEATRPRLVLGVATWKGRPAVFVAEARRELGCDAAPPGIDARCASLEQPAHDRSRPSLAIRHGRPTFDQPFHAEVRARGLEADVTAAPRIPRAAAQPLGRRASEPIASTSTLRPRKRTGSSNSRIFGCSRDRLAARWATGASRLCRASRARAAFAGRHGLGPRAHGAKFVLRRPDVDRHGTGAGRPVRGTV